MTKLTPQECQTLIEALDSWVIKDLAGEVVGATLLALTARTEEQRIEATEYRETLKKENAQAQSKRKEIATLLQAKLIQIRTELSVDDLTGGAQ